jgi:hypothetical protein
MWPPWAGGDDMGSLQQGGHIGPPLQVTRL